MWISMPIDQSVFSWFIDRSPISITRKQTKTFLNSVNSRDGVADPEEREFRRISIAVPMPISNLHKLRSKSTEIFVVSNSFTKTQTTFVVNSSLIALSMSDYANLRDNVQQNIHRACLIENFCSGMWNPPKRWSMIERVVKMQVIAWICIKLPA